MSQIFKASSSSPPPPSVPTNFVAQTGTAVPALNILLVNAYDSSEDNANGIVTKGGVSAGDPPGSGATNELDIYLTNRLQGTGTTVGATTADLVTFALGASPGAYLFNFTVAVFNAATPASAGYETYTTIRTTGAAASIIDDTDSIVHEEAALITTNAEMVISGNNAIFRVTGVVGLTINWAVVGTYVKVT